MLIKTGDWPALGYDARRVRHAVFVIEQNVPVDIELDAHDATSIHAVVYDSDGRPVGTGRLLPDAHIGRMAVLRASRRQGVGALVLESLIQEARRKNYPTVILSAQTHAVGFYEGHGFAPEGAIYLDAGIEHILMRRCLLSGDLQ